MVNGEGRQKTITAAVQNMMMPLGHGSLPFTRHSLRRYGKYVVADWWCKAQDPRKLIASHPSFLAAELIFVLLCILTFCHACRHGGRYLYTWIGTTVLALLGENIRFWSEKFDLVWHAQGLLMFCGMRTPLYAFFGIYQMLVYTSYVMARRMRLPLWAEGPAVGLLVVLISFPLQLMGVKLLWWQWHDSDPSMADRIYSIPWNMLFFDASVGCSFAWTLHLFRRFLLPHKYDWMLCVKRIFLLSDAFANTCQSSATCISTDSVSSPKPYILAGEGKRGLLEMSVKIHSGVVTLILLATYAVVVIVADRHNVNGEARPRGEQRLWFDELACGVCIHYLFYMTLTMVVRPENVVAEGLHQPIGMCNVTEMIDTPWGMVSECYGYGDSVYESSFLSALLFKMLRSIFVIAHRSTATQFLSFMARCRILFYFSCDTNTNSGEGQNLESANFFLVPKAVELVAGKILSLLFLLFCTLQELERQKYICAYGHEGKYFDFHCLPGGKAPTHIWDEPLEWYIMCGTPFENRLEYIVVYVKRSAERPKITTMERQDSEELKGMLDEELDLKKTEDTEEMAQAEADMKGERSRSRTRMGRSSSKGKLSPTSQIPMPTSAHELRSRKKKADS
ncbi:unnamed protein product [Toxocara canis]|uniref:Lipase_3 domain-containing protein n=1 Tax=Toxocara canis TaxID=6265 RepID=A0A183V1Q5_TOXCA|nr:unnamed protein product [Toxocara canis]